MGTNFYNIHRFAVMVLIVGLILHGCKKDDDPKTNDSTLNEKVWTLKYIQNKETSLITYYPEIKEKITIEFADNKQLIFDGVCNTGGGYYALEGDKITISSLIITEIYCTNVDWESIAGAGLGKAYQYKIDNGKLIIYSDAGYSLVFE